ncbi:flagellar hook protein FlgE [Rhodoblastus acidophilus]|uniref:Flagellar hook protein FlgE n=1 Tax=Rhodoblastus acidophilus TaxID=1074 RepID=A0A212RR19_RHOAC|nr:flagellar hook protein FlgE [Rhodoblastus acidophilus]SNB74930.1 flagellar hook protein FlgE [Rhodoblastus acidophilus]
MGLYDAMNASVTGMNAQSNYLSNIGQNISNSSTPGYKEADTQFSTLVNSPGVGQTASGGVATTTRLLVDKHGTPTTTNSVTDLAISGDGFFVVSDKAGQNFLTRAGSFVKDDSGNLYNAAGYYLMGYDLSLGTPTMASNSLTGMTNVKIPTGVLPAVATSYGTFSANLDSGSTAGTGPVTPTNVTSKTSVVMYDSVGSQQTVSLYFKNITSGGVATWSVAAYDSSGNLISGDATYPYPSSPSAVGTPAATTLKFTSSGALDTTGTNPTGLTINVPGSGGKVMTLDMRTVTQYASAFALQPTTVNGNASSSVSSVSIGTDGTLSYKLGDGSTVAAYKIPLASVASPNNLLASTGNVFSPNLLSGPAALGGAGTGKLGTISSSALEGSTVDVATELTHMIMAQRNYQANSKMFSTGAQLMDTLINMQV